jgi:hypothetical protein
MGMNDDPQRKPVGRPFCRGDSRINRAGRPKGFDEVRALAQMIAGEDVVGADGNTITRAELLLRQWSRSKNPMLQKLFVEIAFGPVPPTKVEANALKPRTTLFLHFPHELGDRGPSAFRVLPPSDDGVSPRLKGP